MMIPRCRDFQIPEMPGRYPDKRVCALLSDSMIMGGAAAGGGFFGHVIEQSLRLNRADSPYLTFTPATAGDRKNWTFSCWIKPCQFDTGQLIFAAGSAGSDDVICQLDNGGSTIDFVVRTASTIRGRRTSNAVFRDPTAWYHVVFVLDSDNATADDRMKVYVNGVEITDWATKTNPADTIDFAVGNTVTHVIGANATPTAHLHGYLAEVASANGQVLDATSFGELDANGNWAPKSLAGLFGTNDQDFHLDFADDLDIGNDVSGNDNDFTANNLAAADVVTDSPTNSSDGTVANWPVFSPIDNGAGTLSEGNTKWVFSSGDTKCRATIPLPNVGKWRVEVTKLGANNFGQIGIGTQLASRTASFGAGAEEYMYQGSDGNIVNGGTGAAYGNSYTADGDDIDIFWDGDNGTLWFAKNGTLQNGATESELEAGTTTNAAASGLDTTKDWYVTVGGGASGADYTINFGQFTFQNTYSTATSYINLNSKTLAGAIAPAITKPDDYFAAVVDTEANIESTLASARSGWSSYVDILKNLDVAETWAWRFSHDSGNEYAVAETATRQAARTLSGSNEWVGYSIRVDGDANVRAGSVSHTNGSDTSVSYTSVGTTRCLILLFPRSGGEVPVFHPDLVAGELLNLTGTNAPASDSAIKNVTASGFDIDTGEATDTYDYLVIPEVAGFVKLYKYTGNGNADGPVVHTGFLPKKMGTKDDGATSAQWQVLDRARNPFNLADRRLYYNLDIAESEDANGTWDFLSTGMKARTSHSIHNQSGIEYFGIAFAEMGFDPALASGQPRAV